MRGFYLAAGDRESPVLVFLLSQNSGTNGGRTFYGDRIAGSRGGGEGEIVGGRCILPPRPGHVQTGRPVLRVRPRSREVHHV